MIHVYGVFMRLVGRCHRRLLWWWSCKEIKISEHCVDAAIAEDDMHRALRLLEHQQREYKWHFQVERFIFRPDFRPVNLDQALALLVGIHKCESFLLHQCFYAGISAAYISIQLKDQVNLDLLRPWLFRQACLLGSDQLTFSPHWRNRECPYKQTVSVRACLLQLCLAEGRVAAKTIESLGNANLRLLNTMSFREISADVLYRSTTNLLRGLLCLSFDRLGCHQLYTSLKRLRTELECRRYRKPVEMAKENHLGLLSEVQDLVQLALASDSPVLRERRLAIMINTVTPDVAAGARDWLDFLELNFSPET
ncbi:MAG: hypothetical protein AB8A35_08245 [Prochlorococcus sp.]